MKFRQVHLDFHTSEAVPDIGKDFTKENFQKMLKAGHVDSITVFSKCHHGWSYHPTKANKMHPGLSFDLLGAQIEAAHEIGVKTPVYLSAGLDEKCAVEHPEWVVRQKDESTTWVKDFMTAGYHVLCFNTPYLSLLAEQVKEVLRNYDADGIFMDIVSERPCYCHTCNEILKREGKSIFDEQARQELAERTYLKYAKTIRDAIDEIRPGLPLFHNGGHVGPGAKNVIEANTHLELESLPTGGWGYDHFPASARYVQRLGKEFLGMTGKFHTSWGEFGGFKHPNALKYETALSIANGAKCSIGDQLHPKGAMDEATYDLIGKAYAEVEKKEPWCDHVTPVTDIGILCLEGIDQKYLEKRTVDRGKFLGDVGCNRIMLEGKYLYDRLDPYSDFSNYKLLILPDQIYIDDQTEQKIRDYVNQGGKVLLTGKSGLLKDQERFLDCFALHYKGKHAYRPTYFTPVNDLKDLKKSDFVIYTDAYEVEVEGEVAGWLSPSYFNRSAEHFCSHRHTPCAKYKTAPGIICQKSCAYIAWEVFTDYAENGSLYSKEIVLEVIDRLLGMDKTVVTNLPAQGIVTVMEQKQESRYVAHLLYAAPVVRGKNIQIIEDLPPVLDTVLELRLDKAPKRAYLAPEQKEIPFELLPDGRIQVKIDRFTCHKMIVFDY